MTRVLLPNLARDDDDARISPHELACYHAGEGTPEWRAYVEATLRSDVNLRARLDALVAEERAFAVEMPLPRFMHDHEVRVQSTSSPLRSLWSRVLRLPAAPVLTTVVSACAVLAFVVLREPGQDIAVVDSGLRDKGAARVSYFIRDAQGAHLGRAGETLHAGAQIQFSVRDDVNAESMVLVGVDGRGEVTVYAAEPLEEASVGTEPRLLPASVVLDDAVGTERFFVVYSHRDVVSLMALVQGAAHSLAAAHADLATTATLPLPDDVTQGSVHIVKAAP
jgi:hypothetical protein